METFPRNEKQITIKDIAKICGVGAVTVSRVINNSGYVCIEKREKIEKTIREYNFVPNRTAINFKKQMQGIIALLIPTALNPFFSHFLYHTENYLYQKGYKMILVNSQGGKEKEINVFNMLPSNQVDGIILVTHHKHEYDLTNYPVVTIDRHLTENTPYVTSNNYDATFEALELLYDSGCRRIGSIIGKTLIDSETGYRNKAYRDFIAKKGLTLYEYYDIFNHGEEKAVVQQFFENNPKIDGLFTGSDTLAMNAYYIAKKIGKKIPEDFQIIAYDGILEQLFEKKITAVVQPIEVMAKRAVDILVARINKEPFVISNLIPAKINLGETTINKEN